MFQLSLRWPMSHQSSKVAQQQLPEITAQYPFSQLSLSHLLDKVVHLQISRYDLAQHTLLPDSQFAVRQSHSTEDALALATTHWLQAKQHYKTTGVVFVDLPKAFDNMKHEQLMSDSADFGVSGHALRLALP